MASGRRSPTPPRPNVLPATGRPLGGAAPQRPRHPIAWRRQPRWCGFGCETERDGGPLRTCARGQRGSP
eukprot:11201419-Lingulodinium_polyedra.AAC.1